MTKNSISILRSGVRIGSFSDKCVVVRGDFHRRKAALESLRALESRSAVSQDPGTGRPWPLCVWTARVIKNQLRPGLGLIAGDRRKGIRRMVVNMGITLLSSGIM